MSNKVHQKRGDKAKMNTIPTLSNKGVKYYSNKLRTCPKCKKQYIKSHKCPNKDIVTEYKRVIMEGRA